MTVAIEKKKKKNQKKSILLSVKYFDCQIEERGFLVFVCLFLGFLDCKGGKVTTSGQRLTVFFKYFWRPFFLHLFVKFQFCTQWSPGAPESTLCAKN